MLAITVQVYMCMCGGRREIHIKVEEIRFFLYFYICFVPSLLTK